MKDKYKKFWSNPDVMMRKVFIDEALEHMPAPVADALKKYVGENEYDPCDMEFDYAPIAARWWEKQYGEFDQNDPAQTKWVFQFYIKNVDELHYFQDLDDSGWIIFNY